MKSRFRRMGGAVVMAFIWAVVWAPLGVLTGVIVDPSGAMDEMWLAIGAYPGFLCGAVFCAVVGIAEGGRAIDALALSRAGAWGALSGLLVGVFPFLVGTVNTAYPLWLWGVATIAPVTALSSASAVVSALVARMAKKRAIGDASGDIA